MPESRLPISVCLIASNEAHRIRAALESVAGWTSEIVVVLNHDVNDGTDKIAESFGAKVFREQWKGFLAQKNSASAKATQPWILGLDADEVVSGELGREIREHFSNSGPAPGVAAFSFPRCTLFCGRWIRHGDWYPDRKIRLWRRDNGAWAGQDPHPAVMVTGRTRRLKFDLLHYSMEDLNHLLQKTITYTDTFAGQKRDSGQSASLLVLWFRPLWRFLRAYFLRFGFLDGWQGLGIAWMAAFYTFLRYAKIRELQSARTN